MKRVLTMFLTALLVMFTVPQTVHATEPEPVKLTVSADKSAVNPGDTVNYTVSLGTVDNLGGLEFKVKVPEGLAVVEDTVAIPDGVAEKIDSDGDIVKPANRNGYKWSYSAQRTGYTGNVDLVILTFSCTVSEDAALGDKSVTLEIETCFDNTLDLNELVTDIVPAKITVEKPKVAVSGITLDKNSLTLKDGETAKLTATIVPEDADNKTVTWSSDNTAVATVADGTVTAVKTGTARITATAEDGSKNAVCTVTVICSHKLDKVDAVAATCGKDGNVEYYTCSKCGKKYSDAAGTKEISDVIVPATGEHKETELRGVAAATEEKEGYTGDTYCKECGTKLKTGNTIPKLPHTHSMTKTAAVAATCEKDGNIEYFTCSKCSRIYADEAGTKEITDAADVIVKAVGHKADGVWKSDEENHWQICTVCSGVINKAKHSFSWVVDKAATEDETGLGHEECICGQKRSEGTVIPKLDHVHTDIRHFEAVDATCIKKGIKEYWTCSGAKCAGKYYGDAACQIEIADIAIPINPDNHVQDGVWSMSADKHVRTCVCGAEVDEGVHVYDNSEDAYCNVCNYRRFYIVTSGANASYEQNSKEGLTFGVDGEFALFQSLEIDGAAVAAEHYTLAEGSTIITLKDSYLNTLETGEHELKILYSDGKIAVTSFSVKEEDDDTEDNSDNAGTNEQNAVYAQATKTGDDSHAGYWFGMLIVALAGIMVMTGIAVHRKKQQ